MDIYSEWAGPCTAMSGALKKIKLEVGDDNLIYAMAKSDTIPQLEMFRGDPILRVHIVRPMQGLDTEAYFRAVCRIQSQLPCNINRQ